MTSQATTTAPLPSPPSPPPAPKPPAAAAQSSPSDSLPGQINVATRKQHTELNRLIVHRLSLALPPHAETPELYGKGLVPFARIFLFFEVEWDLLARQVQLGKEVEGGKHDTQIRRWLAELRPAGLPRSGRAKEDLKSLRFTAGPGVFRTLSMMDDEWTTRMRVLIRAKPHVLVAFAWVMYMAVFSGGRWIRQQLANAGEEFWTQRPAENAAAGKDSRALELPGFTFLSFDGAKDGEELKTTFKTRLAEAETFLTAQEREDVVAAAQEIFDYCIQVVYKLDAIVLRQKVVDRAWSLLPYPIVAVIMVLIYYYWLSGVLRSLV